MPAMVGYQPHLGDSEGECIFLECEVAMFVFLLLDVVLFLPSYLGSFVDLSDLELGSVKYTVIGCWRIKYFSTSTLL